MKNIRLTVGFVDAGTPEISKMVIRSFEKFCPGDISVEFLIVYNYEPKEKLTSNFPIKSIVRNTKNSYSIAHGEGLEAMKGNIETDYIFICHNDVLVTSPSFFDEMKSCMQEEIMLAGVCEDKHPDRVKALHCSGLLVRSDLYCSTDLLPSLPTIDTADKLTLVAKEKGMKTKLFRNTYNDSSLVDLCNSPWKELGPTCGVDRCLDSNDIVMFVHQGRGTTKYSGGYNMLGKVATSEWLKICSDVLN